MTRALENDVRDHLRELEEVIDKSGGRMTLRDINMAARESLKLYHEDLRKAINLGIKKGELAYTDGGNALLTTVRG